MAMVQPILNLQKSNKMVKEISKYEIKELVKRISEGKGLLAKGAEATLSNGYNEFKGMQLIEEVYSQVQDDKEVTDKMFDKELIEDIFSFLT